MWMLSCSEVHGSGRLPTNQNRRKRKLSMRPKFNLQRRHCVRLISCLQEAIDLSQLIGIQSSVVMYVPFTTPNKTKPLIQTIGTSPLTAVIDQLKDNVMVLMEGRLQDQALQDLQSKSEKENLFHLPPLAFDGVFVPVHEMTQAQLRCFIPLMIKYSMKRARPGWGRVGTKPPWWPAAVPWKNVRTDHRPEDVKKVVPWTDALRRIVIACYHYHGRTDLLDGTMSHISAVSPGNFSATPKRRQQQKQPGLEPMSQTGSCGTRKEMDGVTEWNVPHLVHDAAVSTDRFEIPSEKVRGNFNFLSNWMCLCVLLLLIFLGFRTIWSTNRCST